jgi:small subunit ribosomal protein S2
VAVVTTRQLLEAGVHFGHQTRRWNPKMRRFILGERNGIYIIDLRLTLKGIEESYSYIRDLVARGGIVLFVGTKKQTQGPVATFARACGMPYVNERWLGGMLTNFATISLRVRKMQEYEAMESSGDFEAMPKREALRHRRELDKLRRNLGGFRNLDRVPDAIFVIDTKKEHIAVTEANKLGMPVVAVVDTNCDPDQVTYVIPGNDDAIRSGSLMCRVVAEAVKEGQYVAANRPVPEPRQGAAGASAGRDGGARRSRPTAGSMQRPQRSAPPTAPVGATGDPQAAEGNGAGQASGSEATFATPAVESAPVESAPVESAPVESAPVESAPVESAPVESAPVEAPAPVGTVTEAPVTSLSPEAPATSETLPDAGATTAAPAASATEESASEGAPNEV